MTFLRLLPHISVAIVDGRSIFLDVRRDRYFALESEAEIMFATLRETSAIGRGIDQPDLLLGTGLFELADEPVVLPVIRVTEPETGVPRSAAPARFKDVLRILMLLVRARYDVRFGRLEHTLSRRSGKSVGREQARPASTPFPLVKRFHQARQLIPIRPVCLHDSLALHDWLARHGVGPLLVLGVKLDPFEAHCWLQLKDVVLNDEPDRVAAFTPILVVE